MKYSTMTLLAATSLMISGFSSVAGAIVFPFNSGYIGAEVVPKLCTTDYERKVAAENESLGVAERRKDFVDKEQPLLGTKVEASKDRQTKLRQGDGVRRNKKEAAIANIATNKKLKEEDKNQADLTKEYQKKLKEFQDYDVKIFKKKEEAVSAYNACVKEAQKEAPIKKASLDTINPMKKASTLNTVNPVSLDVVVPQIYPGSIGTTKLNNDLAF